MWIDPFNNSAGESLPKPRLFSYRFISVCLRNHSREGRCVQMHQKRIPLRMCAGCGESKPKKELVRVVRSPEGEISLRFLHARQHRAKAVLCDIPISTASRSLNNLLEKGEADAPERLIHRPGLCLRPTGLR